MSSGWDLEVGPAVPDIYEIENLPLELHPASLDVLLEKVERECADLHGYRDYDVEVPLAHNRASDWQQDLDVMTEYDPQVDTNMDPAKLKHVRTDAGTQRALWKDQLEDERTTTRVRGRMRRYLDED